MLLIILIVAVVMFVSQVARLWFFKKGAEYLGDTNQRPDRFMPWRYPFYLEQANYSNRFMPWRYGGEAPREYSE